MLKHMCEGQNRTYVTLDNSMARALAQTDPALFFQTYKPPILIDEVQYALELFSQIKILCDESEQGQEYFNSYIGIHLMRDITEAGGITDYARFRRLLSACAALTGEQINYNTLAEAADTRAPTAKAGVDVLEGLCIVYRLRPYSNNALKRLSKTPKLYFCDTGLCASLSL